MNQYDTERARVWAKMPQYKKRISQANKIISASLETCKTPYVSCSFGKDSAVMLHLVLQHQPNIPVKFLRWRGETENIDCFDAVIDEWLIRCNINLEQIELSRDSLSDNRSQRWSILHQGCDLIFIGLRAQESKQRRISLRRHGASHILKSGIVRSCPIAWWETHDVAAYVAEHKLPMLNTYELSIDGRTSARVPRENYNIRENFYDEMREINPDGLRALQQLFDLP